MKEIKSRILIVDDEESILRNLQVYLEDEGFDVVTAGTGEEGLAILAHSLVHGAIVDIRLPGMDGNRFIELAHHVKPDLVFLIYSGSVDYKLPANLERLGVEHGHVFKKPLGDMSVLSMTLRNRLHIQNRGEDGGETDNSDH